MAESECIEVVTCMLLTRRLRRRESQRSDHYTTEDRIEPFVKVGTVPIPRA